MSRVRPPMSYNPNLFSQTDPPRILPQVPSPSPFSPEVLPAPNIHGPHPTGYRPVDHGQSQGLNLYTPYNIASYYQQPTVYSHPHHTPYHVSTPLSGLPSHPIPQPNFTPARRSALGDAINLSTPVSHGKGTRKELQKRKGAENDENQAHKRQRHGKKQSTRPASDGPPPLSSNSEGQPPPTQPDPPASRSAGSLTTNIPNTYQTPQASPNVVRVPGVGPSAANDTEDTDQEDEDGMGSRARDVWVFLRPLETKEPPPPGEWPQDENEPMSKFPKESQYAGCKLCYRKFLFARFWRFVLVTR